MHSTPSMSKPMHEPDVRSPPIVVAATFEATRAELAGAETLLGSAEVARDVVEHVTRVFDVLALTPLGMRRVDGWLGGVGVVTHPASPLDEHRRIGSVCDRTRAAELVGKIIEALVDGLPSASDSPFAVGHVGALAPSRLPHGASWVVIVSVADLDPDESSEPDRFVIADVGGLVAGTVAQLDQPAHLLPISRQGVSDRLDSMLGDRPPSVADLLAEN